MFTVSSFPTLFSLVRNKGVQVLLAVMAAYSLHAYYASMHREKDWGNLVIVLFVLPLLAIWAILAFAFCKRVLSRLRG